MKVPYSWAREVEDRLRNIEALCIRILKSEEETASQVEMLMPKIEDVEAKVAEVSEVENSVITLLDQVHAMLVEARNDPAKIQAVLDSLDSRKQALAEAVLRNTDAA